jgi:hypothetical protein
MNAKQLIESVANGGSLTEAITEDILYDFQHFMKVLAIDVQDISQQMVKLDKLDKEELEYAIRVLNKAADRIKTKYLPSAT